MTPSGLIIGTIYSVQQDSKLLAASFCERNELIKPSIIKEELVSPGCILAITITAIFLSYSS